MDGTLKVKSMTNHPELRYQTGKNVFLQNPKTAVISKLTVISYRSSGDFDFVKFQEIETKEQADELKGGTLKVIKNREELEKGHYYFSDLVGCQIIEEQGNILGVVSQVEEFPAQITLRVKRQGKADFFIPFLKEFILEVDISNKKINIRVMEGML